MPFPLAHPAAVLPFRRFCPRRLDFTALVIGSLTPDVGYCFSGLNVHSFAHSFRYGLLFGLPMGWLLFLIALAVRAPLAAALPEPHRDAVLSWCRHGPRPPLTVSISLSIGIATHLVWDSFAHPRGWLAQHWPVLQATVFSIGGYDVPVCRLLWYLSTVAGLGILLAAYLKRLAGSPVKASRGNNRGRYLFWAIVTVAPYLAIVPFTMGHLRDYPVIYGIRRFIYVTTAVYLVVLSLLLLVIGFSLRFVMWRRSCRHAHQRENVPPNYDTAVSRVESNSTGTDR